MTKPAVPEIPLHIKAEIGAFVIGLAKEGERSAVVLGAARLDVSLEKLLKKLLHHHAGAEDNLFDPDRPLGSFSAKISLAYRLGVIDREFESALQIVRKIRNDFAHSIKMASLSESHHSSRVEELFRKVCTVEETTTNVLKMLQESLGAQRELSHFCIAVTNMLIDLEFALIINESIKVTPIPRLTK